MSFDDMIDRRGTHCVKWDGMEGLYGVSPDEGIAMWVADMDFRPRKWCRMHCKTCWIMAFTAISAMIPNIEPPSGGG